MSQLPRIVTSGIHKATSVIMIVSAVMAGLIIVVRSLVHFPFYDETIHAHYLWLLSQGKLPGIDFFSTYPVLGYLFVLPVFKLFPESAFVLLALRFITLAATLVMALIIYRYSQHMKGDWVVGILPVILLAVSRNIGPFWVEFSIDHFAALFAITAMTLMLGNPKIISVTLASSLCVLSILIMPKYALPLSLGLLGLLAGSWKTGEFRTRFYCVSAGSFMAVMSVAIIYWLHSISLFDNLQTVAALQTGSQLGTYRSSLARYVAMNIVFKPVFGAVLVFGVIGWCRRYVKPNSPSAWSGIGILTGTLLLCVVMKNALEQYQAPIYLSLAVFSPFALFFLKRKLQAVRLTRFGLALACLFIVVLAVPPLAKEFTGTSMFRHTESPVRVPPAFTVLQEVDNLLKIIPENERVAAQWMGHPIFRMDVTELACDAQPSFTTTLPSGSSLRKYFAPERLRAALLEHPPALIDLSRLDESYPPGWAHILRAFLAANRHLYQDLPHSVPSVSLEGRYIRKDLVHRDAK